MIPALSSVFPHTLPRQAGRGIVKDASDGIFPFCCPSRWPPFGVDGGYEELRKITVILVRSAVNLKFDGQMSQCP